MDERYPIGHFEFNGEITSDILNAWISDIEQLPGLLRAAVKDLDHQQLDTPYRPGGWTVRQVVHHLADTNLNVYVRFKLALTADNPVINSFDEVKWAELPDTKLPVDVSLALLESLHIRLCKLLRNLSIDDFKKVFIHPVSGESLLGLNVGFYAWHGKHHLAQITSLCNRNGW